MDLKNSSKQKLIRYKKTHRAILFTILVIISIYLMYMGFLFFTPEKSFEPILTVGLIVMVAGMLPSFIILSSIDKKLKEAKE